LRITCDLTLPVALEAGHAAIECSNELEQVVHEGLVRSRLHAVSLMPRCSLRVLRVRNSAIHAEFDERCALHNRARSAEKS
jgi:hypothetical protein